MRLIKMLAAASVFSVLSACGGGKTAAPSAPAASQPSASENADAINQQTPCFVDSHKTDAVDAMCKPGQKVVFMPPSWGNEQLPIVFAGLNCDLRYSVVSNNGGVTCIRVRRAPTAPAAPAASK